MTEKTEEMIERERQAVISMADAKANMTKVLDRVETLEKALRFAQSTISELKNYIADGAYAYPISDNPRKCKDVANNAIAAIVKVLS
jgi:hypothetical protein